MYLSRSIRGKPGMRLGGHHHAEFCSCHRTGPLISWMHRRVTDDPRRRARAAANGSPGPTAGTDSPAFTEFRTNAARTTEPKLSSKPILLTNLRLFDGRKAALQEGLSVRIEGNKITDVLSGAPSEENVERIDCGGRVLMPGLIDAHWHSTLCGLTQMQAMTAEVPYIHLIAAREAEKTLMRGFTSIRDAGGPSFALKQAIDQGLIHGPRIYPSGAMISQTSGHGDFRMRYEIPATGDQLSHAERAGVASIADGSAQVLQRAREQLMLGASQIKLMAGGGVTSAYDPLESAQFTEAELRAGVDAASDWGTYVMVHVYTAKGIQRAVRAGVKSIEHGQLADEDTARLMADEGVWWSLQPFLGDEDANTHADPRSHAKQQRVAEGTVRAYEMAQRLGIRTAWGTDILFTPQNLRNHGRMLAKLTRFYTPLDLLRTATGQNGELLGMSGLRNPYDGALGVIEPGALADLLLVDGDPSQDLDFLTDPEANLRLILKDGKLYKSTL